MLLVREMNIPEKKDFANLAHEMLLLSGKLGGAIPVKSIWDSCDALSRIYGFNSYAHYNAFLKNKIRNENGLGLSLVGKDINKILVEHKEIVSQPFNISDYQSLPRSAWVDAVADGTSSENFLWTIGYERDEFNKIQTPISVDASNLLITGSYKNAMSSLLSKQIEWALEMNRPICVFNAPRDLDQHTLRNFSDSGTVFGDGVFHKIDLIHELIEGNALGVWLSGLNNIDEDFLFMWIGIVTAIKKTGVVLTIDGLEKLLEIQSLIDLMSNKDVAFKAVVAQLGSYLKNEIGVVARESDNVFEVSASSMAILEGKTTKIAAALRTIREAYNAGYFKVGAKTKLTNLLCAGNSFLFLSPPGKKEVSLLVNRGLDALWSASLHYFFNKIKNRHKSEYRFMTVFYEAEDFFVGSAKSCLYLGKYDFPMVFYCQNMTYEINELFRADYIGQIMFLKQSNIDYSKDMVMAFLSKTNNLQENIWFDSGRKLKDLPQNKFYLWACGGGGINIGAQHIDERNNQYKIKLVELY